ncbi:hypothetical protein Prudu_232S000900 [Prunus dulcis]|uniref:Aminotransferase-like plant mobile domain-containing protein n=1 Tax=Prunus dulcis TaxID=3755 RepID=A0A5H2Y427_PRUDU|nr:hypothetical protein Prudu_232S000900 [Prunus dulcis]
MGLGNLKADLDYINHWKYGSLKATRQFVKVQSNTKLFFWLLFFFNLGHGRRALFEQQTEFWFEESCWQPAVHPFSFGKLRSFGKGYHSASDRVRTLCGFCKLLQRNAALVTFVARFATCSFSNLQIWNFALLKNTRKVFSEYHNVPMDTHKVFTAVVQWGSCRSPSVIHNREVLMRALFVPRGTDIVEPVVASRMDANGQLYVQRVLDKKGLPIGQEYDRSMPLNSVQIDVPPEDRVTWFTTENVNSGYCEFIPDDGILKVCRVHGSKFEACTLMEVNNNTDGDTEVGHKNDFPPILCKMLKSKTDWGRELSIRGLAEFRPGILEWTEAILRDFKEELFRAEIYGAVAVSRYPYMYLLSVWKAFLELWGPLTNTLHQGNGEMGISLYDLKIIGGLPILGVPYEEFIPPNRDLHCEAMFPPTIRELLLIYSQLCSLYDQKCVFWDQWVAHFFRGKIIYGTFGEGNILKPRENLMARKLNLEISTEGRLTAFLAFFLSRFALPSRGSRIRPETFTWPV